MNPQRTLRRRHPSLCHSTRFILSTALRAGSALAIVLVLTGCFRLEQKVSIESDGSGEIELTALVDPEVAFEELTGERIYFDIGAGYDRDQMCAALKPDDDLLLESGELVPYERDDLCGIRQTVDLEPSNDHSDDLTAFFGESTTLRGNGESWEFESALDADSFDEILRDEIRPGSDARRERLLDEGTWRVEVTLPGAAVDGAHNADDVDGGRFRWTLDPLDPPERIFAATEPAPPFSFTPAMIGVLGAGGLGLAALAWFFLGDRGPKPSSSSADPSAAQAVASEPYFDEAFGVWVRDDPVHGRVWHESKTDRWVPF